MVTIIGYTVTFWLCVSVMDATADRNIQIHKMVDNLQNAYIGENLDSYARWSVITGLTISRHPKFQNQNVGRPNGPSIPQNSDAV